MKALFNKFILLSMMSMLIWSCKKDEVKVIARTDGAAGTLTTSSSTLVLAKANATQNAVTFTFTAPDFGYAAAVTSSLQLAAKGTNFANPKEFSLEPGATTKSFTVIDFNALLLSMNLAPGSSADIEARVKTVLSPQVAPTFTNAAALKVTPYALVSFIYVPGDYQGWNPGTADSLISATSNGIYEGIIKYAAGGSFEFKITPKKEWTVAYGDAGGGSISASAGDNLKVPGAGTYKLTADLNANTFTAVPYSWGIVGSAPEGSNWGGGPDFAMSYNNGTRLWTATVPMAVGEFKFRLNSDWGVNYGDKQPDGVIDGENDNNIKITEAGTYKIELNMVNNTYTKTKI
ncbi:MAG: SusE domain-containing protein [Daejeonella sp.]